MFLLTDTDHEYTKDKLNAIPIAYALKGKSLKTSICRQMMNDVQNFLCAKGVNVLVEAYDGQWSGLVFRGQNNEPLTPFEVQRDAWLSFASMSKDKLVEYLTHISNKEAIRHYAKLFLGISKYIIHLVEIILDYFAVVPSSALISPIIFEDN